MAALTLIEGAKLALDGGDTKKAAIMEMYAENSDIVNAMRFEGIAGNALSFTQEGTLPATAFRGVNEAFTASTGTVSKQTEALCIAGGDLDVDRFIVKTGGPDVRARHEAMKVKSLTANITDVILNGSNATEPREFDGLKTRITESTQLLAAGSSSGGDALSLKKLDQLVDSVNAPTHLIMSRAMKRKFLAAWRSSTFPNGRFQMGNGSDGGQAKPTMMYNDLPILTGYPQNRNTQILPFAEANPNGGAAVGTSIYCVNFNEDGCVGISNGGIDVRDLGELNTAPVFRTRVEWYLGFANYSQFARARLWGVKDADIVA